MNIDLKHIITVGKYTFHEIYKTKVFFTTFFIGFCILSFTILATKLSFGAIHKVSLDISLGLISLSAKIIALVYGMNLLKNEIDRGTLQVVLSRAISRESFLLGKIFGLFGILTVNITVIAFIGIFSFLLFGGKMSLTILLSLFSFLVEGALVLNLSVCFSLFMNQVLGVLTIVSIFFASYFIPEIIDTSYIGEDALLKNCLRILDIALPQFHRLNIKDIVLYEDVLEFPPILATFLHSTSYCFILIVFSAVAFQKKSLE